MQRADAASPTTPDSVDLPSAKRQKLGDVSLPNTASNETQTVQIITAAEEAKRVEALESQTGDGGETKWVLRFNDEVTGTDHGTWRVLNASYAELDTGMSAQGPGEEPWRPKLVGRRSFGKFNRAIEVCRLYVSYVLRNRIKQYVDIAMLKLADLCYSASERYSKVLVQ